MAEDRGTQRHDPPEGTAQFSDLELVGGRVCLDFVNTVDPRAGDHPRDYLASYTDLVRWAGHAQLLSPAQVAGLLESAARQPDAARAVFDRAIALRETLYRIFSAVAAQHVPNSHDLAVLHAAYVESLGQARLAPMPDGLELRWPTTTNALDQLLWPIVRSAVELATSPDVRRVKACPGLGDCGWLFLDTSKSGRRRWCSMESCGSRAKMRTYYARTHARPTAAQHPSPTDNKD